MSDETISNNQVNEIEALSLRAAGVKLPRAYGAALGSTETAPDGQVPFVVIPGGHELQGLEHLFPAPFRIRKGVALHDLVSFMAYWKRFNDEGSVVCANLDSRSAEIRAILDYHDKDKPSWCTHEATYALRPSDEWTAWTTKNRQRMTQVEFAEFIEDRQEEIVSPDAASLLEIITNLSNKRNVSFRSAVRLADGRTQLEFSEEDASGTMTIPQTFTIGIAPFYRYDRFKVIARLRYRIEDNGDRGKKLVMWYELNEPERVREKAFNEIAEKVADETGPLFFGKL